jgi:hypothetical protein
MEVTIARVENGEVKVFEDNGQILRTFTPGHGKPVSAQVNGDEVVVQLDNGQTSLHSLNGQVLKVF